MIKPIRLGDELFPYVEAVFDRKTRYVRRADWDNRKQISLNLRTIDYFMQFDERHGSLGLINLIEGYYITDYENADKDQQERYDHLLRRFINATAINYFNFITPDENEDDEENRTDNAPGI